jgi:hypothetical protein
MADAQSTNVRTKRSRSTGVERQCEVCKKTFHVKPAAAARGRGRFCSTRCHYTHIPLEDRFLRHVGPPQANGCVLWRAAVNRKGYATIGKGGAYSGTMAAHRYAWERVNGPIPEGLCVCHHCDEPRCLNPEHLFLGTHADNKTDCVRKGRHARGEGNAAAKLTEDAVRAIRRDAARGMTIRELCAREGVGGTTIRDIIRRKTWKYVAD